MVGTVSPLRVDADLVADADVAARLMSRSVAQQVSYWARIGRELEASTGVSLAAVVEVLEGRAAYDDLAVREQAVVRANWEDRLRAYRKGMDLSAEFVAKGLRYAEIEPGGSVVIREPGLPHAGRSRKHAAVPRTGPAPGRPQARKRSRRG